jgi:hypothetical protein
MGQFQKGQRANPTGRNQYTAEKEPGEPSAKSSKLVRAMRWVAEHEEGSERNPLEKHQREWLKEDRKSFFTKLADLEKALSLRSRAVEGVTTPREEEFDEGSERCLVLLEEFLGQTSLRAEISSLADTLGLERALDLLEAELNRVGWPPGKKESFEQGRRQRAAFDAHANGTMHPV